jgi:hypothetical protein
MQLSARLTEILERETALQHLSERVQGMMLMGQDRDELKIMTVTLVRHAKSLAELCGDQSEFAADSYR